MARVRFFAKNVALFIEKFTLQLMAGAVLSDWNIWDGWYVVRVCTHSIYNVYRASLHAEPIIVWQKCNTESLRQQVGGVYFKGMHPAHARRSRYVLNICSAHTEKA